MDDKFSQRPVKEFPSLILKGKNSLLVHFSQPESTGTIRIFVHDMKLSKYKRIRSQKKRQCFWVALSEVVSREGRSWCELDLVLRSDQEKICSDKLTIHHDPKGLKGVQIAVWSLQHTDFVLAHTSV